MHWVIQGDLLVDRAAQLHAEALTFSQGDSDLVVDGQGVTAMDVSTLQILWALHDALTVRGRGFRLDRPSPQMCQAMLVAGCGDWLQRVEVRTEGSLPTGESSPAE